MTLADLDREWDLIVAGGGITGAGVFREATRSGLKCLLVESKDFVWGTSSRSAKLVHGGLRYLKEGRVLLTRDSVRARQSLLKEAPGLVEPLGFLMPVYKDRGPGKWALSVGLAVYDLLGGAWRHKFLGPAEFERVAPYVSSEGLLGGFEFHDAQVDDARLVLRVLNDGIKDGGIALNYTSVDRVDRDDSGYVNSVIVSDVETGESVRLSTTALINATGAWAERLHPSPNPSLHLRPLRGSHLIFPADKIPIAHAISFTHPADGRPVYAFPWEGAVLFGTTDLDHSADIELDPAITETEVTYLMDALGACFPNLLVAGEDCISTFAGIRPVLSEGKLDPSQESREHVVWVDKGLVTVTGGKLTTYRLLAWDTLEKARPFLRSSVDSKGKADPAFAESSAPSPSKGLEEARWRRLLGRYGEGAQEIVELAGPEDLEAIPGTHTLWAELPFVARKEQVRHLSDLLLRRVRIGLLTPDGGAECLPRIRQLCERALPWDDERWRIEIDRYRDHWRQFYGPPVK